MSFTSCWQNSLSLTTLNESAQRICFYIAGSLRWAASGRPPGSLRCSGCWKRPPCQLLRSASHPTWWGPWTCCGNPQLWAWQRLGTPCLLALGRHRLEALQFFAVMHQCLQVGEFGSSREAILLRPGLVDEQVLFVEVLELLLIGIFILSILLVWASASQRPEVSTQ